MVKGKPKSKSKSSSDKEAEVDAASMYEEVKKDLSALSRDEQMDVVYRLVCYSLAVVFIVILLQGYLSSTLFFWIPIFC